MATGRYGAAAEALSRAATLAPDDADLAASWGEALVHAAGFAAAGVRALAPWREAVDAVGSAAAWRLMADSGLAPSSLCRAGRFPAPDSARRAAAHGMVEDGVAAGLPHARAAGVRLALEPLHPMYAAGYAGPIEVEIFSAENRWRRNPVEVVAIAKRRFADCVRRGTGPPGALYIPSTLRYAALRKAETEARSCWSGLRRSVR